MIATLGPRTIVTYGALLILLATNGLSAVYWMGVREFAWGLSVGLRYVWRNSYRAPYLDPRAAIDWVYEKRPDARQFLKEMRERVQNERDFANNVINYVNAQGDTCELHPNRSCRCNHLVRVYVGRWLQTSDEPGPPNN